MIKRILALLAAVLFTLGLSTAPAQAATCTGCAGVWWIGPSAIDTVPANLVESRGLPVARGFYNAKDTPAHSFTWTVVELKEPNVVQADCNITSYSYVQKYGTQTIESKPAVAVNGDDFIIDVVNITTAPTTTAKRRYIYIHYTELCSAGPDAHDITIRGSN
jgi:hypothetical protein